MLAAGEPAPDFELPDQHGETVAIADFDAAVVYFYPRADTPGCTTQACGFRDQYDAFERRGVPVFGVSDDPVEDLAAFAKRYDLPFRLLADTDGAVAHAYDSYDDEAGRARRNTYVVADGTVECVFEGVDPEGHAEEILAAL